MRITAEITPVTQHDQDRTSSKEMEVAEPKSKLANLATQFK
jgi:hypothetical protein